MLIAWMLTRALSVAASGIPPGFNVITGALYATDYFAVEPPVSESGAPIVDEETLGGAEMHTGVSGLGEYLAEDDREAVGMAREVVARLRSAPTPTLPQRGRE